MKPVDVSSLPFEKLIAREWLAVNGLGGYACSTLPGMNTRKYHGLLVAAMTPPVRRMVLLSRVEETLIHKGWNNRLACNEYPGTISPQGHRLLRAFSHEPYPRWAYQGEGWTLEKTLRFVRGQNTVCLSYTLLGGDESATLELNPLFALRGIHELTYQWNAKFAPDKQPKRPAQHHRILPTSRTPEVFFAHDGKFTEAACWYFSTIYRQEEDRGYAGLEDLWMPGTVRYTLSPGQCVHFICSTDPIDLPQTLHQLNHQPTSVGVNISPGPISTDTVLDAMVRAADQFVCTVPQENSSEKSTAVMNQYPWASPCSRDALIAFPGLFLITERFAEGRSYLLSLLNKMQQGVLPSAFPEDGSAPLYHGADISLWFINAAYQYLNYTSDEQTFRRTLLDSMEQILRHYQHGTSLGIHVDANGLLASHEPGVPTSWMDATSNDWVITPRQGKTVEINALWYNALRIMAELAVRFDQPTRAREWSTLAEKVKHSFNQYFWNESTQCCYDAIDDLGRDPAIRPNQLLAMSLRYPVLAKDRHPIVLSKLIAELLTPFGLRTLSPRDPAYQGHYRGDPVSRDRAYHQGSVFPWLLGSLVTVYLRIHGRGESARHQAIQFLSPCMNHLRIIGIGQLPELFDGDSPHAPGGCIASAASIGEILRAYVEDILDHAPSARSIPQPINISVPTLPRALPSVATGPLQ